MSYLPKTRTFNNKRFRLHGDYLTLSKAEWEANKLRSKGWKVRVIKLFGLYGVYKRR
jgi:hypothetical protein